MKLWVDAERAINDMMDFDLEIKVLGYQPKL